MNRNYKFGIIAASVAVILAIVSMFANNQGMTTSGGPRNIAIDFSVYPENHPDPIVVERGAASSIPLKVEAPNDAEKTLHMRLSGAGSLDPSQLNAELSQTMLVLSKVDVTEGKVTDLGGGRGIRDAGMLTLSPPTTMSPGEYSLALEVEQQINVELGDGVGSGTLIYITVR